MFGLGAMELMVILALALIVLGPKKLPELAKQLAKLIGDVRRVTDDLRANFEEASRDVGTVHPPLQFPPSPPSTTVDGQPLPGVPHEGLLPPELARLAVTQDRDGSTGDPNPHTGAAVAPQTAPAAPQPQQADTSALPVTSSSDIDGTQARAVKNSDKQDD